MPAWRIQAPAPAADLVAWYHEAEAASGVPWQYLAAINLVETGIGRIHGLSTAGAQGPMQFLPSTWEIYGERRHRGHPRGHPRRRPATWPPTGRRATSTPRCSATTTTTGTCAPCRATPSSSPSTRGAYAGFHAWGIWYWTTAGDIYLPVGWESAERVPVDQYVAAHPNGT